MTTYVIGDIHGNFKALKQCIDRSSIDKEIDTLICLGDICDGYDQVYDVINELLEFKNLILIKGNHDKWTLDFIKSGWLGEIWLQQGGKNTINSYRKALKVDSINEVRKLYPITHKLLLESAVSYYIDDQNRIFVHGGFNEKYPIEQQTDDLIMWDRDLVCKYGRPECKKCVPNYRCVFAGHTTSGYILEREYYLPVINNNVVVLDTGAGYNGKLTIMDVDTLEFWQSDYYDI